jgi:nucleoid-associated protein YgaU
MRHRGVRTAALAATDIAVLITNRPHVAQLAAHLAHPRRWLAGAGADVACGQVATAAIWLVAAWLALGLLVTAGSRLPGLPGRCAARASRLVLPRAVRALLAGSAGLGVLLAPVAAGAAMTGSARPVVAAQHGWAASRPAASRSAPTVPSPTWPLDGAARPATPHSATRVPTPHVPASQPSEAVTVRPGDSLWLIAARRLGPRPPAARIAAEWPRWYAANRQVIGDDPTLISPGQVLHAPATDGKESR